MKVEIYIGLGTGAKRIWSGALDCLPRINESICAGAILKGALLVIFGGNLASSAIGSAGLS